MAIRVAVPLLLVSVAMSAFAQQPSPQQEELAMIRQYCKADIERLCPNVKPGGSRIKECLMAQKAQISVGCAQALQKLKQHQQ